MQYKNQQPQEWIKILGKGMVTIPKRWRDEARIATGDIVRAKKEGNKIIIELQDQAKKIPYRIYSDAEIEQFLKDDKLPKGLAAKIDNILSSPLK